MPRYCAASCCKNRGGQSARDQRKLSFYPFPLHDKERLEKWLRNMKRDAWTPSKHQLLCSDHFTPDSLDVRWGIRYLKQTAVPTIFSSPDDQTNMATTNSPKTELEKDIPEFQVNLTQADFASSRLKVITEKDSSQHSPQIERLIKNKTNMSKEMDNATASPEPCAPKKNIAITESLDEKAEAICSALSKPLQKKKVHLQNTENVQEDNISLNSTEHIHQTKSVLMAATVQNIEASIAHASIENPLSCTATVLQVADPEYLDSSLKFQNTVGTVADYPTEHPNSHMAGCSVEVRPSSENAVLFSTITQTIEQLNGNEESVIAIIVPAESSKESEMVNTSFMPIKQEFIDMEEIETEKSVYISNYGGTEVLQTEHSYCKQDIDRDHLWQKIAKLHSKITLLEMQEIKTLGRLRSLEALIGQLKQENLLSEEKLKIVENCFTTFEVTMIQ